MKLRFRSVDGKEVTKLDVPNPCTLRQLQRILLDRITPSSSSSSSLPSSVGFSLNRKDELRVSSGDETLQSLGVASGDLLFYSLLREGSENPSSENPSSLNPERIQPDGDSKIPGGFLFGDSVNADLSREGQSFVSPGSVSFIDADDSAPLVRVIDLIGRDRGDVDSVDLDARDDGTDVNSGLLSEDMDLDVDDFDAGCSKFSEPYFLRRVLRKELRINEDDNDRRILVLAVHAVMLESGFVGIDPANRMPVDGFLLPEPWPSRAFSMSLHYSFPEIPLGRGDSTEGIVLRFQTLGQFTNVYGSLGKGKSDLRRVCLNGSVLSPKIESVLSSCDCDAAKGVFEFWKIVKDGLALPLSIDLSERAGLVLPSCFARLPMELKSKILESLSGVDLAKVGCVCSELNYLSKNNDLWKCKCIDEFGERVAADQGTTSAAVAVNWRQVFVRCWEKKRIPRRLRGWARVVPALRIRRDPHPFGAPCIIGGDYDRLPVLGIPCPHGGPSGMLGPRNLFRRGVMHRCILVGANSR